MNDSELHRSALADKPAASPSPIKPAVKRLMRAPGGLLLAATILIAALCLGWFFRLDFQARENGAVAAFMLNRWTGSVYLVAPSGIREIPQHTAASQSGAASSTPTWVPLDAVKRNSAADASSWAKEFDAGASLAADQDALELLHPGWRMLTKTEAFRNWLTRQSKSVQELYDSKRLEDANELLSLYNKDGKR